MTKTAFLFAGQGAQACGMARDLYDTYVCVRETFDEAHQILGYDIRALIDQDEASLNQTRYTQPAILTTSVAIYRLLVASGLEPDMVAGLSLGEYSALVASGSLTFEDALRLVAKRGAFMEAAAPPGTGKMVAVLNTAASLIEDVCQLASQEGLVSPANYNTPSQIVIGGEIVAVNRAVELLKERGCKRLIPLNVSGPFHTALLKPASQQLADVLAETTFLSPRLLIVGNTEADVMAQEDMKDLLRRQVMEPVRFYESIEKLQELGAERFVEIGPGKILAGFVKKIDPSASVVSVEDLASFEAVLAR